MRPFFTLVTVMHKYIKEITSGSPCLLEITVVIRNRDNLYLSRDNSSGYIEKNKTIVAGGL